LKLIEILRFFNLKTDFSQTCRVMRTPLVADIAKIWSTSLGRAGQQCIGLTPAESGYKLLSNSWRIWLMISWRAVILCIGFICITFCNVGSHCLENRKPV